MLVRPDGIIAWRPPAEAGLVELEGALRTVLG
ncbi:aromatic-ring hydroxylase C-terminal domain-containing protein [Microbispora siamensis]